MSNQNNFLPTAGGAFALSDLANELQTMFGFYAAKKGLQFNCCFDADTAGLRLTGEASTLKLMLYSLLSNAIRFTDKGSITIAFSNRKSSDKELDLRVSITDSGRGIESEKLSTLFTTHSSEALGLSICHRLVTAHGGTISANSQPGKGSEFNLSLPFAYFSSSAQDAARSRSKTVKVLVVDDDEMSMLVISNILAKHSIMHTLAYGGYEALSRFGAADFDILITDLHMPELNGEQLLKELRLRNKKIPAIAVTSGNRGVLAENYISKGFSKVLIKPFREEDLMKALKTVSELTVPESREAESSFRKNKFSTDELCRISNNSDEFVRMMLEKFAILSVANTERMLTALVNGDSETVMQLAHKSIPSFHMLGLTATAEHLKCIERNVREEKDLSESSVLIRNVHEQTREIVAEIKKYLNSLKRNEVIQ